jgi:hypothetical protein
MKTSFRATLVALAVAVAACSDRDLAPSAPVAPEAARTSPSTLLGLTSTTTQQVTGVQWRTPLLRNLTATASIGPLGGVLELPATGLRVVVPPGAVLRQTQFGVTALAGSIVAYDFQPAGAKFLVPLVVTQSASLVNTTAPSSLLTVMRPGYFKSATDLDPTAGTATVSELLPKVELNLLGQLTFTVSHFSGYIVCWSRGGSGESVE